MSGTEGAGNSVLRFSIFFFASSEETLRGTRKYRLVIEAARFADRHGFEAVWVPERHFATFGGLYPNPSVLQAALAAVTERIALRAGSVVLPLHHPIRLAEEWSMVDNLSGGRIGISFASGWNPHDFTFFPERYGERHRVLFEGIPLVQRLWRGEALQVPSGTGGEVAVTIYPRPVQPELPTWVTAAGNPASFAAAGRVGANLLTHLLDQDVDGLAEKIESYRQARADHGHDPAAGVVTLMLHTFLGTEEETTRELGRKPYCEFLKTNAGLLKGLAASRGLPAAETDFESLSAEDQDSFVNFLYDRFVASRSLIGTPEGCLPLVERLHRIGVDEIAALLDFGPPFDQVLTGLPHLDRLRELAADRTRGEAPRRRYHRRTAEPALAATPDEVRRRCPEEVPGALFYRRLAAVGIEVGEAMRGIERLWRRDGEALGRIRPGSGVSAPALTPPVLDACLQVALAAVPAADQGTYLPWGMKQLRVAGPVGEVLWSHAVLRGGATERNQLLEMDLRLLGAGGAPVAEITGARLHRVPPAGGAARGLGEWTYTLAWEAAALVPRGGFDGPGSWLIFADRGGVGERLAALLVARGQAVQLVTPEATPEGRRAADGPLVEETVRGAIDPWLESRQGGGVVHLWALDAVPLDATGSQALEADQLWGTGSALLTIQALAGSPAAPLPRLWLVTRGAQAVSSDGPPLAVTQTSLWGLGRTCAVEHPELWGGLIDLDPQEGAETAAARLLDVLTAPRGEDQLAFRGGRCHVPRLVRCEAPPEARLPLRPDGSYLITGGHTGLGLEVARYLVGRGARHLVLLGRTPVPPRETWPQLAADHPAASLVGDLRALEELGAEVAYGAVDVAEEGPLASFLADREQSGAPPLRGIIHAASVWRDGRGQALIRSLAQLDLEALGQVLRPKVLGGFLLHRLSAGAPLDFFKLFSSGASVIGSAGQGNYAAANSFLDALAHHRRLTGQVALSVNWGPVSGAGFGATEEGLRVHAQWERNGLHRLTPRELTAALEPLLGSGAPQLAVMKVDWRQLGRLFPDLVRSPWASRVAEAVVEQGRSGFLERLAETPPGDRLELLTEHLQQQIAEVMGVVPEPEQKLFDLGLDSLMAVALRNRLEHSLGAEIRVTAIFNYPTLEALAGYLAREALGLELPAREEAVPAPLPAAHDPDARGSLAWVQELSDDEVERRLTERLARQEVTP